MTPVFFFHFCVVLPPALLCRDLAFELLAFLILSFLRNRQVRRISFLRPLDLTDQDGPYLKEASNLITLLPCGVTWWLPPWTTVVCVEDVEQSHELSPAKNSMTTAVIESMFLFTGFVSFIRLLATLWVKKYRFVCWDRDHLFGGTVWWEKPNNLKRCWINDCLQKLGDAWWTNEQMVAICQKNLRLAINIGGSRSQQQ